MRELLIAATSTDRQNLVKLAGEYTAHYAKMIDRAEFLGDAKMAKEYDTRFSLYLEVADQLATSKRYYRQFVQLGREYAERLEVMRANRAEVVSGTVFVQPALL